jgi:hypothetical protein
VQTLQLRVQDVRRYCGRAGRSELFGNSEWLKKGLDGHWVLWCLRAMRCILKVILDDDECRKVDAACVQQTAGTGALVNRSDLVRLWIAAGCPVVPTDPHAAVNRRILDRLAQSPKPADADSAAAPVVAGSEGGVGAIQWGSKPMCVHDWKPNADESQICRSCGAIWIPGAEKSASNQPAAADADAGAAPARAPIDQKGGVL